MIVNNTLEEATSIAKCDDGDIVIMAGYNAAAPDDNFFALGTYEIRFTGNDDPFNFDDWKTILRGELGTNVRTDVLCFDNPPAHIP